MRILYLTSDFPFPLTSGHLRYFHFMRELARSHHVELSSLTGPRFREEHERPVREFVSRLQTFPRADEQGPLSRIVRKQDFRLFWSVEPAMRALRAHVAQEHRTRPYDAVVLAGKRVLPAVRDLTGVPIVADVCDAESLRFRLRLNRAPLRDRARAYFGYRSLRYFETRVVQRADRLLFAAPRDRDAVTSPDDPHAFIVPNGIDLDYWQRSSSTRDRGTIVFVGAMDYRPNADAAHHLLRETLPRVRVEVPDAKLLIVGRDPAPALIQAGREAGAEITGTVDDVRPYLERATVFAAPLPFASGIQNKILEALALDVPVVTSTPAADGLRTDSKTPPPLQIADDPEEFAARVAQQLRTEGSLDRGGRDFVKEHFSWQRHAQTLERVLVDASQEFARGRS